jgi:AcrR family transcriptional regulator
MGPYIYTREDIVTAALRLIREEGWPAVSARAVARQLGSSTMPIYSHINSIGELENELRQKARELLRGYQQRRYSGDALLDKAFGYLVFARDECNLFRFLFSESEGGELPEEMKGLRDSFLSDFPGDELEDSPLGALTAEAQEELIRNAWIYTHGLASLVNTGALGSCSDEQLLKYLRAAGEAFYLRLAGARPGS